MAIQLGTVAAIGFEDFASPEWLACFRRLGCTTVQAYRNTKVDVSVQEMIDYIAAGQMPCDSLHGIYGEEYDPSALDEDARSWAIDASRREGELALRLDGTLVVIHCATIRREGIERAEHEARIAQLRKSVAELGRFGEQIGVTYAFENLPAYHAIGYDVGELSGLLADVAAPRTGMCFDTGHAHMVGDLPTAIRAAGGQIVYVHLSDNSGEADQHIMPTYGTQDIDGMARALREVGYHGTLMLETFYGIDELKTMIDEGCADRLAHMLALANGSEP
jgi:sugar phosphate isomerase/epimerase